MASSSSTPATMALAAPQGPPPSSTLPCAPPPTPATQAPAAPQEPALSPIRIATYNLGVPQENAFTSTQKAREFEEKLNEDLAHFRHTNVQVICFQEGNDFWSKQISFLLTEWDLHHARGVVIARKRTEWRDVTAEIVPFFPNHPGFSIRGRVNFLQVSPGHR